MFYVYSPVELISAITNHHKAKNKLRPPQKRRQPVHRRATPSMNLNTRAIPFGGGTFPFNPWSGIHHHPDHLSCSWWRRVGRRRGATRSFPRTGMESDPAAQLAHLRSPVDGVDCRPTASSNDSYSFLDASTSKTRWGAVVTR